MNDPQDWSGEAGHDSSATEEVSDFLTLPVGIKKDGNLYRELYIDKMRGVDDHNIASNKVQNNGSVATSLVLCRCIQEVPGLLQRKLNSTKMFDRALARNMCNPDRDYVLSRIYMLSNRDSAVMAGECTRCTRVWEEEVFLSQLPVITWPDDKPWEIPFQLEDGFCVRGKDGEETYHKEGVLRFPMGKDAEGIGNIKNLAAAVDSMIAACVIKVGEITSVDTSMAYDLTSTDRQLLMVTVQRELPGLRQWKEIQCRCGATVELKLDLASFLDVRRRKMKKS